MKKIVFIQGSPRLKGNTRAAARAAMDAAREAGAEVAEIDAVKLKAKVHGCLGCNKCQESDEFRCSVDDELGRAVAGLPAHDVIVLATPLYWWSYTAQIKAVIDRMYCLNKLSPEKYSSALTGKKIALLATGGGGLEDNLELLEKQWRMPAQYMGLEFASCLLPFAPPGEGGLAQDAKAMAKAAEFGRRLAED